MDGVADAQHYGVSRGNPQHVTSKQEIIGQESGELEQPIQYRSGATDVVNHFSR
jgi:hypothetical protein